MLHGRCPAVFSGDDSVPPEISAPPSSGCWPGCTSIEENCPLCKRPAFAGLPGNKPDGAPTSAMRIADARLKLVMVNGQRKTNHIGRSNLRLSANRRNSGIGSEHAPAWSRMSRGNHASSASFCFSIPHAKRPEIQADSGPSVSKQTSYAAAFFSVARAALALCTRSVNPAASFTAISARILRSSSMPAFFRPLMNCE
jgi:hypothetical protein